MNSCLCVLPDPSAMLLESERSAARNCSAYRYSRRVSRQSAIRWNLTASSAALFQISRSSKRQCGRRGFERAIPSPFALCSLLLSFV